MEGSKPLYKQKSFLRLDIDIINENDKEIKYKKKSGFVDNLKNTVNENKIGFAKKLRNLVKEYKAQTGAGIDERYVIKLDLTFSGSTYEFMFGLDDRTKMGTDVLLNRFVMNKLNVMVNPQRKYVITTKYSLD